MSPLSYASLCFSLVVIKRGHPFSTPTAQPLYASPSSPAGLLRGKVSAKARPKFPERTWSFSRRQRSWPSRQASVRITPCLMAANPSLLHGSGKNKTIKLLKTTPTPSQSPRGLPRATVNSLPSLMCKGSSDLGRPREGRTLCQVKRPAQATAFSEWATNNCGEQFRRSCATCAPGSMCHKRRQLGRTQQMCQAKK